MREPLSNSDPVGNWSGVLNHYAPAFLAFLQKNGRCSRPQALACFQAFASQQNLIESLNAASAVPGGVRKQVFHELNRFMREENRCKPCFAVSVRSDGEVMSADEDSAQARRLFDVTWAQLVITTALRRMKLQCQNDDQMGVWTMFDQRLCSPILTDKSPVPYHRLVDQLGLRSPAHAHEVLLAGKRMFSDFLTAVVSEYEFDPARVNQEKSELHSILAHR